MPSSPTLYLCLSLSHFRIFSLTFSLFLYNMLFLTVCLFVFLFVSVCLPPSLTLYVCVCVCACVSLSFTICMRVSEPACRLTTRTPLSTFFGTSQQVPFIRLLSSHAGLSVACDPFKQTKIGNTIS